MYLEITMTNDPTKPLPQTNTASLDEMAEEADREPEVPANGIESAADSNEERPILFPLGRVVVTTGALDFMVRNAISAAVLLEHHQAGDWGDVCAEDAQENVLSLKHGLRVMSAYRFGPAQEAIWVITEADRSVTTILLPSCY